MEKLFLKKMFNALFKRHPDSGMQSSRADYEVVVKDHDLVDIKTWYFQPVNICFWIWSTLKLDIFNLWTLFLNMVDIETWYFQPVNIVFEYGLH